MRPILIICIMVLLVIQSNSQKTIRDPNPKKDVANVYFNSKYTLFDLLTDEPIFPDQIGIYNIYYATNEDKRPRPMIGTSNEICRNTVYKFKNKKNCEDWCNGIKILSKTNHSSKIGTPREKIINNNSNQKNKTTYFLSDPDVLQYLDTKTFKNYDADAYLYFYNMASTLRVNQNGFCYQPNITILSSIKAYVEYTLISDPSIIVRFIVNSQSNSLTDKSNGRVYELN